MIEPESLRTEIAGELEQLSKLYATPGSSQGGGATRASPGEGRIPAGRIGQP